MLVLNPIIIRKCSFVKVDGTTGTKVPSFLFPSRVMKQFPVYEACSSDVYSERDQLNVPFVQGRPAFILQV